MAVECRGRNVGGWRWCWPERVVAVTDGYWRKLVALASSSSDNVGQQNQGRVPTGCMWWPPVACLVVMVVYSGSSWWSLLLEPAGAEEGRGKS